MPERPLPAATTVPDVVGQRVGAGDVIAAAFTDFGNPALRVGKVLEVLERTHPTVHGYTPDPTVLLRVRWHAGSVLALMPLLTKPTKIDAGARRFVRVELDLPDPEPATPAAVVVDLDGATQPTLEESL